MRRTRLSQVVASSLWVAAITVFSISALFLFFAPDALADGFRVPDDYASIQAAVDAASDGDTVLVASGEYVETTIIEQKQLTILGEGKDVTVVHASRPDYLTFAIRDSSDVSLRGMRLMDGSGGVSVSPECSATLENLEITRHQLQGIGVSPAASAVIDDVTVSDIDGSGLRVWGSIQARRLSVKDAKIGAEIWAEGDQQFVGSDIEISGHSEAGVKLQTYFTSNFTMSGFDIHDNLMGINVGNNIHLTMETMKVSGNQGVGIRIETQEDMTVRDCEIYGNSPYDVEVTSGRFGRILDFQHNNWGEVTTAEMEAVGFPGNISSLWDQQDDPLLCMVDFSNWENPTAIEGETPASRVGELVLHQNAPNPFNPSTAIRFNLPAAAHATLNLYDLSGQRVKTLLDGELAKGEHSVSVELPNLASGVYLYRLETPQGVESRRMSLLK